MSIRVELSQTFTDIIIPTFNNFEYLGKCLSSILPYTGSLYKVHIVNNGTPGLLDYLEENTEAVKDGVVKVHNTGKNLGWIGGINYVKDVVTGPFVLMMNDDTQVIHHDWAWLRKLQLPFFLYPNVGAVGPISDNVGTIQQMNRGYGHRHTISWLSGFCLLTKKDILDKLGWLDESLPGGDDVDFSLRLREAELMPVCTRDVTVLHAYGKTGKRLYGDYWDSLSHAEEINMALIRKHGLKKTMYILNEPITPELNRVDLTEQHQIEKWLVGRGLNLGCGNKEYANAVGVDLIPYDSMGHAGSQIGQKSKGTVQANVEKVLPFKAGSQDFVIAQHIIEHLINPMGALREWNRVLKKGGKLLLCTPDEDVTSGIVLDPTHTHVFDKDFLSDLVLNTGYKILELKRTEKYCSLFLVAEKL